MQSLKNIPHFIQVIQNNYYDNFGLWQGSLNSGTHTILVEYRNNLAAKSEPYLWQKRALTIVHC